MASNTGRLARQQSIEEKLNIPVRDPHRFKTTHAKYAAFIDEQLDTRSDLVLQIEENDPTLTTVSIRRRKVQQIIELADLIKKNTCLREVEIGGGGAQGDGIIALTEMWAYNLSITSLTLVFRRIEQQDVETITKSTKMNKNIVELSLQFDSLNNEVMNDDGVEVVAQGFAIHGRFVKLGLNGAQIGPNGANALIMAVKANPDLKTLNISNCKLESDCINIIPILDPWSSLQSLNLSNNNIGSEGAVVVASKLRTNNLLTKLFLSSNRIRKEGMVALAKALEENKTLEELDISDNAQPGVEGMQYIGISKVIEALYNNKSIKVFHLTHSRFCAIGMTLISKLFRRNKTLETFYFGSNILRNKGIIKLMEALQENTTLTHLDIYSNLVSSEGGKKIGEFLEQNRSLKKIRLGGTNMEEGVARILNALKINTSLEAVSLTRSYLSGNADDIAEIVGGNSTLKELDLQSNKIGQNGLCKISEALRTNEVLKSLKFSGHTLKLDVAKSFSETIRVNKTIETLLLKTSPMKVSYTLGEEGVKYLLDAVVDNTTLRNFSMDCSVNQEAKIARILKRNLNLIRKRHGEAISNACSQNDYPFLPSDICFLIVCYCF